MMLRFFAAVLIVWGCLSLPVSAKVEDETILYPMPKGFVIGHREQQGRLTLTELIPEGETLQQWSSMVTVLVMRDIAGVQLDDFAQGMGERLSGVCKDAEYEKVFDDVENGYPFTFWVFLCPASPTHGQTEYFWMKLIKGRDAIYSIQYAFRGELTETNAEVAASYLKRVIVCDSRHAANPCPAGL